jgi:glycosyltransferase involved in cell wall biosynthesis
MKIMHYFLGFPPLHNGGLMIYVRDLSFCLKTMGHDVYLLMPGPYVFHSKRSYIKFYKRYYSIPTYYIINPLAISFDGFKELKYFMEEKSKNDYEDFFEKIGIDILHIHSLIGLPYELVKAAKKVGIKVVYTTHDYFGLCPKIFFYRIDNLDCLEDYSISNCSLCNSQVKGTFRKKISRDLLFLVENKKIFNYLVKVKRTFSRKPNQIKNNEYYFLRKENINYNANSYIEWLEYEKRIINEFDYILFNSNTTKEVYSRFINLKDNKYEIINVSNCSIKDNRNMINYKPLINGKVIFSFLSGTEKIKGFNSLVNVFNEIKDNYHNWELHIYGTDKKIELNNKNIKFMGKFDHKELVNIMEESSVILLPSKGRETFGLVGLESISYGIPVLISDKVGLRDIIKHNYNGFIVKDDKYDKYLKEQIVKILENPNILLDIHYNIKKMNFDFDMDNHVRKVIATYEKLMQ